MESQMAPNPGLLRSLLTREPQTAPDPGLRRSLAGLRVRVILEASAVGGAELQAAILARYLLDRERCDVEVWTLTGDPGELDDRLRRMELPRRALGFTMPTTHAGRVAFILRLAARIRADRADVLLPFASFSNLVTSLAYPLSGARACVWNERVFDPAMGATRANRIAVRLVPALIANSRKGAEALVDVYGARKGRVHVVRNGVALRPPERDRAAWRAEIGAPDDAIVACMVANLHGPNKDHATLIRAFGLAMERFRPARALLVCAGAPVGDMDRTLRALAAERGVAAEVVLPGRVTDIAGLLSAADIGVFSSNFEGTPNGVIECMAMGLPIVATDLPGIRDALGPAGDRWLVPIASPDAFADRLLQMLRSPELRAAAGRENRRAAEENFTIESMGSRTAEVIRSALVC